MSIFRTKSSICKLKKSSMLNIIIKYYFMLCNNVFKHWAERGCYKEDYPIQTSINEESKVTIGVCTTQQCPHIN